MSRWICEGCGKTLHPSELTRVGIGVHHYDYDKDTNRDGLLNCGLVKAQRDVVGENAQVERSKRSIRRRLDA